jgi:hypothetical protein
MRKEIYSIDGQFEIDKPLLSRHKNYLSKFLHLKRYKRNIKILKQRKDPVREEANLPLGEDGEFYVAGNVVDDSVWDKSILDYGNHPITQPSSWCLWSVRNNKLAWNECSDDFGTHADWLKYLVKNFFDPWGYMLNGQVKWRNEDKFLEKSSAGKIKIINNQIEVIDLSAFS